VQTSARNVVNRVKLLEGPWSKTYLPLIGGFRCSNVLIFIFYLSLSLISAFSLLDTDTQFPVMLDTCPSSAF
jgi:hypothetical protein